MNELADSETFAYFFRNSRCTTAVEVCHSLALNNFPHCIQLSSLSHANSSSGLSNQSPTTLGSHHLYRTRISLDCIGGHREPALYVRVSPRPGCVCERTEYAFNTLHLIADHIGGFCRARDIVAACSVVSSVVARAGCFVCCGLRAACRHRQSSFEYNERGWVWVLPDTDRSR